MRNRLGLNEIMIVNPSSTGESAMANRGRLGRMAQMPDDDADLYGLASGRFGQDPDDELYGSIAMNGLGSIPMDELGSIPMDELEGSSPFSSGYCPTPTFPQLGQYVPISSWSGSSLK